MQRLTPPKSTTKVIVHDRCSYCIFVSHCFSILIHGLMHSDASWELEACWEGTLLQYNSRLDFCQMYWVAVPHSFLLHSEIMIFQIYSQRQKPLLLQALAQRTQTNTKSAALETWTRSPSQHQTFTSIICGRRTKAFQNSFSPKEEADFWLLSRSLPPPVVPTPPPHNAPRAVIAVRDGTWLFSSARSNYTWTPRGEGWRGGWADKNTRQEWTRRCQVISGETVASPY